MDRDGTSASPSADEALRGSSSVETPLVSVILVSFNRADDLRLALSAIFASKDASVEVIVVDNASTDGAADVAASFPVAHLVRNGDNRGFAEANNQGLALARGKYVALVNNDAVIAEDWMAAHVRFLEAHPEAAAVGGKAYFWDEQNPLGARSNRYVGYSVVRADGDTPAVLDAPDELREVLTLSGAAVVIRRAAIEDVGVPFLEPIFFTYYEETDFFARAIRRGWKLYYQSEPACWHRIGASPGKQLYRYYFYMSRNRLLFAGRHFRRAAFARVLFHFAIASGTALAASLFVPRKALGDRNRAYLDATKWVLENRRILFEHRARFAESRDLYQARQRALYSGLS
jgi:GT2 family glycosyltransferase